MKETQSSAQGTLTWKAALDQPELELGWYQKSMSCFILSPVGKSMGATNSRL